MYMKKFLNTLNELESRMCIDGDMVVEALVKIEDLENAIESNPQRYKRFKRRVKDLKKEIRYRAYVFGVV